MTKKTIALMTAAVIIGVGTLSVSHAFAQGTTTGNPMDSLVQKIATKFNLKKSDVQAVFDEERSERQAAMQKENADRLAQLVKDGKITETQKQLILQKQKEMQADMQKTRESMKNLTPDERRSQMDAKRTELETWAKQHNIDMQYMMPQEGRWRGFGHHRMNNDDDTSTTQKPTQSAQ